MKCKWNGLKLQKLWNGTGNYYSCPNENTRKSAQCLNCQRLKELVSYRKEQLRKGKNVGIYDTRNQSSGGCLIPTVITVILIMIFSL